MATRTSRAAFALAPLTSSRSPNASLFLSRHCRPSRPCIPPAAPRPCRARFHMTVSSDDFPDAAQVPWEPVNPLLDAFQNADTSIPREEMAQPPSGGPGGGSGAGDDGEDTPIDLLKKFGRADEVLPRELSALPPAQLAAYLDATRNGFVRWLAKVWPGWRRRVAADPEFPFKVLMEETVGLSLAASGMIAARGKDILKELDFAICDIAVGGTLNFILVYLLTPAIVVGGAAKTGAFSRMTAKFPANAFSAGGYSLGQRLGGFFYKGALFAVCGFAGSFVGTTLSQVLVFVRRSVASKDGDVDAKPLPNVAINSAAWAGFMFLSSNPRYQTVAGLERVLFTFAPDAVAKAGSGALRTANNVLGGAIWVWWARAIGLQEKAAEEGDPGAAKVE